MDWKTMLQQVLQLADTPDYGRRGGLRCFNSEKYSRIELLQWGCPDWEQKVDRINKFFQSMDWTIDKKTVLHKVESDGEMYARWYFLSPEIAALQTR